MPRAARSQNREVESAGQLLPVDKHGWDLKNLSGPYFLNDEPVDMLKELWILLVYDQEDPVRRLEEILISNGMRTRRSHKCSEIRTLLSEWNTPGIVVTDIVLPDGTWEDVLAAANDVPVIVVSRLADITLYLDVLQRGASDFVVPPFYSLDLAYIIRSAILKRSDSLPRTN